MFVYFVKRWKSVQCTFYSLCVTMIIQFFRTMLFLLVQNLNHLLTIFALIRPFSITCNPAWLLLFYLLSCVLRARFYNKIVINVNCYCSFNPWRDSYRQPSKWDRDAIPGRGTRTSPFVVDASYESLWWKQCTNCKTLWKPWSPLPVYAQISSKDVMLTHLIKKSV